jgi:hypothetical protein
VICFRIWIDSGIVCEIDKAFERKCEIREHQKIPIIEKTESRLNLLKAIIFPFIELKTEMKQETLSSGIENDNHLNLFY